MSKVLNDSSPQRVDTVDKVGGATGLAPSLLRGSGEVVLAFIRTQTGLLDTNATERCWH